MLACLCRVRCVCVQAVGLSWEKDTAGKGVTMTPLPAWPSLLNRPEFAIFHFPVHICSEGCHIDGLFVRCRVGFAFLHPFAQINQFPVQVDADGPILYRSYGSVLIGTALVIFDASRLGMRLVSNVPEVV